MRKPTMAAIASECGVSVMTVSRVFSNSDSVTEETRRHVLAVAERLGFLPGPAATPVTSSENPGTYVILFQKAYSLKDAYFSAIILSIQQELFSQGCGCLFAVIENNYEEFLKLTRSLGAQGVRGIFLVGEVEDRFAVALQKAFPAIIFVDSPGSVQLSSSMHVICPDNVSGGLIALNHLIENGRRRIMLIMGPAKHYFSMDLLEAYRKTMTRHSLPLDEQLIQSGDFHTASGCQVVAKALQSGLQFDSIFTNDEMAWGAIKALTAAGKNVPEDVSIVGFDGLPLSEIATPSLTTMVVDRKRMGSIAAKRMLDMVRNTPEHSQSEKLLLMPSLVVRESSTSRRELLASA